MGSKQVNDFSWKVAGAAGDGILNAGLQMFAKTCLRKGLYVFASAEYQSLIRGGHNHLDVHVRSTPVPPLRHAARRSGRPVDPARGDGGRG